MASPPKRNSNNEWHPWVALTQTCLESTEPSDDGIIRPNTIKRLNVSVSRDSIHRSLAIMNRLLISFEKGGYAMRMTSNSRCWTIVTVGDEDFCIGLRETTTRQEHLLTPADKASMEKFKNLHGVPVWDYVPSGKLLFTIDYLNIHNQLVNQVKWIDGEKKRIEDRMSANPDVLANVADEVKMKRAWADERMRKWREEQDQRQEANRIQATQRKLIKELLEKISAWNQAALIRHFIQAVEEEAARRYGKIERGSPLDQWILSNRHHAETLDPIPALVAEMSPLENCG